MNRRRVRDSALAFSGILLFLGFIGQSAHADLIAYWHFNGLTANTNNGTVYASDFGASTGTLVGFTPAGISANGGTVINAIAPAGAGNALELLDDDNNGASLVIQTDLTFFSDPVLSFADRRNGNGFDSIQLAYSTDGVTYTDFGAPFDPGNGTFDLETFDFSAIDVLDNSATAYFRLTFDGATANGSRVRIDNIQINGTVTTAIPEPSAIAAMGVVGLILVTGQTFRRRKKPSP